MRNSVIWLVGIGLLVAYLVWGLLIVGNPTYSSVII